MNTEQEILETTPRQSETFSLENTSEGSDVAAAWVEALTDLTAIALLHGFMRQPYNPVPLGMLRDRLDEIDRPDLREKLDCFDDVWIGEIADAKRFMPRRRFARYLRGAKVRIAREFNVPIPVLLYLRIL